MDAELRALLDRESKVPLNTERVSLDPEDRERAEQAYERLDASVKKEIYSEKWASRAFRSAEVQELAYSIALARNPNEEVRPDYEAAKRHLYDVAVFEAPALVLPLGEQRIQARRRPAYQDALRPGDARYRKERRDLRVRQVEIVGLDEQPAAATGMGRKRVWSSRSQSSYWQDLAHADAGFVGWIVEWNSLPNAIKRIGLKLVAGIALSSAERKRLQRFREKPEGDVTNRRRDAPLQRGEKSARMLGVNHV